ncbi:MAG: hypothetical protein LBP20_00480 [Treponema sp.]|jgi:hypothetical protein|nr:hypothetical protein [Treponema sp.]
MLPAPLPARRTRVTGYGRACHPPGETLPANPDDLRKSFFTKRKKDMIEFEFGAGGKTAHFVVQIEDEGRKGPWEPMVSALIP